MRCEFETIFLGSSELKNKEGVPFNVIYFMDEGKPVNLVLCRDFDKRQLPDPMSEVILSVHAALGPYPKLEVVSIEF